MKTIIAIDPGSSGGIATLDFFGNIKIQKMPDTEGDIKDLLDDLIHKNGMNKTLMQVYLENVGGFVRGNPAPGSAMFNFGRNYGFLLGCCSGLGLPLELIKPDRWQKDLNIPPRGGLKADEHKRRLKAEAQRRYPQISKITLATCDALLILNWAIAKQNRKQKEVAP